MEKINITKDGLEFVNDAGRKVVLRTNHAATADQYLDLPALAGTITTNTTSTDTDEKSKVSSNDTTAGYLNGKLVAGTNITFTENNNGGNETLTISASGGGSSLVNYTVTTADVENTTAQTTILSFTVPGNTWADGQVVWLNPVLQGLRPTTGDNVSISIEATGLSTVTGSLVLSTSTPGIALYRGPIFYRLGNDLYSLVATSNNVSKTASNVFNFGNATFAIATGYDFTQNFVFNYKVTLASAASNFYIRVLKAYASKANISEVTL